MLRRTFPLHLHTSWHNLGALYWKWLHCFKLEWSLVEGCLDTSVLLVHLSSNSVCFATCLQNPSSLCVELCGCCFSLSSIVTATAHPSLTCRIKVSQGIPCCWDSRKHSCQQLLFRKEIPVTTLAYCLPEATEDKLPHGFGCSGGPHGAAMIFVHICSTCVQLCFDSHVATLRLAIWRQIEKQ